MRGKDIGCKSCSGSLVPWSLLCAVLLADLTALNLLWGSLSWFGAVFGPSRGGWAPLWCDSPSLGWFIVPVQLRDRGMWNLMCLSPVSWEGTVGGSKRSHSCQVWSLGVVYLGKRSLGSASHSTAGVWAGQETVPRIGLRTSANTLPTGRGTFRFLKQSSHESLSNAKIQNTAFSISGRIGDKMPLISEVKISCIQRSLFHVLHSKSNLFCGLTMAETLMVLLMPHVRYFLCRKRFCLNYLQF